MMRPIDLIVVHCSATGTDDIGAAEIRAWHTAPPKKWSDIGYHYVIRRNGKMEHGRPEDQIGAHAQGFNDSSLGICLVGGVSADDKAKAEFNFTRAQMASLEALLAALVVRFPNATVLGHRDLKDVKKACPSFDVRSWWYGANKLVA